MERSVMDEGQPPVETKATTIGRESVRVSLVLTGANLISAALLAVAALIIARLLGPDAYGEYTLALVLPGSFMLFAGVGLNTALTRYSAYHISKGEFEDAKRKSSSAALMLLLVGGIFSVVNFVTASYLSLVLFHRAGLTPLVELASVSVLGQAMLQASVAGFIGWSSTGLAGISSAVQAAFKLGASPILILLGFSVYGSVFAHSISYLLAGVIFFVAFYVLKLRGSASKGKVFSDVKEMISYGFPEYLGRVISQFAQQSFLVILLGAVASDLTIAYYQSAVNVATNLWMVPVAIAQALMPAFARLDGGGADVSFAFSYAQKYASYIVTPIIFFIIGASAISMEVLYGPAYLGGSVFLQLLSIAYLPYAFGLSVLPPLLNGLGRTKWMLAMYLISSAVLFGLAPTLGTYLGFSVDGLICAFAVSNFVQLSIGLLLAKRVHMKFELDRALRSTLAAAISSLGIYAAARLGLNAFETLGLSMFAYFLLYLTLAPALGVLRKEEFTQLLNLTKGLGILTGFISTVLSYEIFVSNVISSRISQRGLGPVLSGWDSRIPPVSDAE